MVEPPQPAVACQQLPRKPPQGKEKPGMFIWKQGTRQAFGQISVDRRGGVNRSKDKTHQRNKSQVAKSKNLKKALPSAEAHDCLHSELDSQQRIGQQQLNARTNVNGDAGLYVISPERAKVWFGSVNIYRQL